MNITVQDRSTSEARITVSNRQCVMCGVKFRRDMKLNQHIPDNNACYNCQFWHEKWDMREDPSVARVDGHHYIIGADVHNLGPKGMGGASVIIHFKDGRIVTTNNLWSQGDIPGIWKRYGLEDNATFGELNT